MTYRVFLPHGPLHLLFMLSLIEAEPAPPALVLLFADAPGWQRLAAGVRAWLPAPHRVAVLPGLYSFPRTLQHPAYRRWPPARLTDHLPLVLAVRRALRFARPFAIDQVVVFNDLRPDVQQIAATLKARRPGCRATYVEDGMAAYVDKLPAWTLPAKRAAWVFRLVYGQHFQRMTSQGQFAALDDARLLYPDQANAALRRLPRLPLPPFASPSGAALSRLFPLPAAGSPAANAARVALICPPRSRTLPPALIAQLRASITRCKEEGLTPLVKLHPREDQPAAFALAGADQLDPAVPSEALVAWLGPRLHTLISAGISTALYTTRWLNPTAGIVLLHPAGAGLPPGVRDLFGAVGVTLEEVPT